MPAIGNTGQLAVDLLAVHLAAAPVATLESSLVLPVVGRGALATAAAAADGGAHGGAGGVAAPGGAGGDVATCLQVFRAASDAPTGAVFLLQQRAPTVTGRQEAFAAELAAWAAAAAFARVLLVSSADAALRGDAQIGGPQVAMLAGAEGAGGALAAPLAAAGVPEYGETSAEGGGGTWRERRGAPWCVPGP